MAKQQRVLKRRSSKKASSKKIRLASAVKAEAKKNEVVEDMGTDATDEKYSTSSLPQTGHDSALDDDTQVIGSPVSGLKRLSDVLKQSPSSEDKKLARRLRFVAEQIGINEPKKNDPDTFSERPHESPGEGNTEWDTQEGGKLEFFGATAPDEDQTGPTQRTSTTASAHSTHTIAAPRKADPAASWKERMKRMIDRIKPEEYEKNEDVLHKVADDLRNCCGLEPEKPPRPDLQPVGSKGNKDVEAETAKCHSKKDKKASRKASSRHAYNDRWKSFCKLCSKAGRLGGVYRNGNWSIVDDQLGTTVSLRVETSDSRGVPMLSPEITITKLVPQKQRVASADGLLLEVSDALSNRQPQHVFVAAKDFSQFLTQHIQRLKKEARDTLAAL